MNNHICLPGESSLLLVELLKKATEDDRVILAQILYQDTYYFSIEKMVSDICYMGGNSVRKWFRKEGIPYSEIVLDAYENLKIGKPVAKGYIEAERLLVIRFFKDVIDSLTSEQLKLLHTEFKKITDLENNSYSQIIIGSGALAVAGSSGFAPYLMATTALGAVTQAIGISLPFAVYTSLTSILSVIIGPIGWVGLGVYGTYIMGKPDLKHIIPIIIHVYAIRSKNAIFI